MINILKNILLAGAFILFVASPVAALVTPQTTYAAAADQCEKTLLGIPPWYRGLTKLDPNGKCAIMAPDEVTTSGENEVSIFVWKIVLNVIQIALVLAGWIALIFIMYGAFLFITGGGNASQVEKGRKSIFNAIIGLIISMGAIAITNLIFGLLDGSTSNNEYGVREIAAGDVLTAGINLAYYIAGIVAVIVIIISGIMYATSMGDSGRVTRSKNMILYAVIGLGVLIAAFAITNFVMSRF